MKLKPLNGQVILKLLKKEETKTKSGIILTSEDQVDQLRKAQVISIAKTNIQSDGTQLPIELEEGDIVLYGKYGGEMVKVDGEDYKVMDMNLIIAKLKK